ncbi:ribosomal large subunit pseudouridine synthase B [Clostridia bacterium]|nr:ribosomal large subunit pseudouridine synthase B [Clostridia bacterium]
MSVRLQKYLAEAGICSRRAAETIIAEGRVTVNGETVTEMGAKLEGNETVTVDGKKIESEKPDKVYIMLNKPVGVVSTAHDQFGRKTVIDCLEGVTERVFPIGRLDYGTSGLLILTNDGELANKLTHPKNETYKTYYVKVKGRISPRDTAALTGGVYIQDGERQIKTLPAKVEVITIGDKFSELRVSIREGKNRQIRKMAEAIGHDVVTLRREGIASLSLGNLAEGEFRRLTVEEVKQLQD